jgi:hypothetical protein
MRSRGAPASLELGKQSYGHCDAIDHFVMAITATERPAWQCRTLNLGPLGQRTAMERFVRRENIKRYRKLLLEAKDDAERRLIQKLLTEEEQKELPPETLSPSTAPRLPDLASWRLPALTASVSDKADRVRKWFSRR